MSSPPGRRHRRGAAPRAAPNSEAGRPCPAARGRWPTIALRDHPGEQLQTTSSATRNTPTTATPSARVSPADHGPDQRRRVGQRQERHDRGADPACQPRISVTAPRMNAASAGQTDHGQDDHVEQGQLHAAHRSATRARSRGHWPPITPIRSFRRDSSCDLQPHGASPCHCAVSIARLKPSFAASLSRDSPCADRAHLAGKPDLAEEHARRRRRLTQLGGDDAPRPPPGRPPAPATRNPPATLR